MRVLDRAEAPARAPVTRRRAGAFRVLWQRYYEAREWLGELPEESWERPELERRTRRLRERLVSGYTPLVWQAAGRFLAQGSPVAREELVCWGMFGLLEAVETYDPGRSAAFETYATYKIRWAILDALRKEERGPRRARRFVQEAEREAEMLAQELKRAPTECEVAWRMGVSLEHYHRTIEHHCRTQTASLEAMQKKGENADSCPAVADRNAPDPQIEAGRSELREQLAGAMESLEERERHVACLYYYEGMTLKEVGRALSLSEGRISQILSRALTKLRENAGLPSAIAAAV